MKSVSDFGGTPGDLGAFTVRVDLADLRFFSWYIRSTPQKFPQVFWGSQIALSSDLPLFGRRLQQVSAHAKTFGLAFHNSRQHFFKRRFGTWCRMPALAVLFCPPFPLWRSNRLATSQPEWNSLASTVLSSPGVWSSRSLSNAPQSNQHRLEVGFHVLREGI